MNNLLSKSNSRFRNGKKIIIEDCIIRKREKLLHVCLNSPGCRFRKVGSCIMCNYGQGNMISVERMEDVLQRVATEAEGMDTVLIGTLGSVFDSSEVSKNCLEVICNKLNQMSINTVIFETHYMLIDQELCRWLKEKMPDKDIVIELGLESTDDFVQKECLNKKIDLDIFKDKIQLLHKFQVSVTVNVFLGSPFLSVGEQIEDTQKTILWAINNEADSTVIFPANIRKGTLLNYLYQNKRYKRISQWQVLEVLKKVPVYYLNRIFFAWYGDWIDRDAEGEVENLPPYSCKQCHGKWMDFYHEFLTLRSSEERKNLLDKFTKKMDICECRRKFENLMCSGEIKSREERTAEGHAWIRKHIY